MWSPGCTRPRASQPSSFVQDRGYLVDDPDFPINVHSPISVGSACRAGLRGHAATRDELRSKGRPRGDEIWRQSVLAENFAMRGHPEQWRPGRFVHPHDARFDAEGNIYVAEWVRTGRITKLIRKT